VALTPGRGESPRTLRDLAVGESAVLAEPRLPTIQRMRLAELGLRPGERVRVTQRSIAGARVIAVGGSRIALDAGTAALLPVRSDSAGEGGP
jgi:ferrous iron transport protein A